MNRQTIKKETGRTEISIERGVFFFHPSVAFQARLGNATCDLALKCKWPMTLEGNQAWSGNNKAQLKSEMSSPVLNKGHIFIIEMQVKTTFQVKCTIIVFLN